MCALHGVHQAYAQDYHHAANGRAEQVGAQLQRILRKAWAEHRTPWPEALPRAIQHHHDTVAPHGLTPYQVLFCRDRPMAGVPYELPPRAEDAVDFFERQRQVDHQITNTLNKLHDKQTAMVNRRRKELPEFKVGDRVRYLRPRDRPGEKLESYWLGPAVVHDRQGEHSYVIKLDENKYHEVHRHKLK